MTQMLTAGLDNVQLLRDRRIELLPGLWPTPILTHEHEQAAANALSTPRQRNIITALCRRKLRRLAELASASPIREVAPQV